jgi:hypothetical protein
MKVSINNVNGLMIEMQSHGSDEAMIANALAQGFTDVSVRDIDEAEYQVLLTALNEANVTIPVSVTMRQARLALLGAGLLNTVTTAINSLPSPQKEAAQIEWEYSQEVHRDKELVGMLAPILGLSDAQIDALFITASAL